MRIQDSIKPNSRKQAKMVRSAGPATHAAGLEEVKRAPPNKKARPMSTRLASRCLQWRTRTRSASATSLPRMVVNKANQQGMFRKVRNLTNGTLANTRYERFFTIYEGPKLEGDKEWFTATGNEHASEISFAKLEKK